MIEFMKQNLEPDRLKNFCIDQIKFMQNNLWSDVWMNNEEQESVQVYACMWKCPMSFEEMPEHMNESTII